MTRVSKYVGDFAGDKDAAARIRNSIIRPALAKKKQVVLDFKEVDFATQSFIHALLAQAVREDPASLERITFKNCNGDIQALIEIVVDYAQEDFSTEE